MTTLAQWLAEREQLASAATKGPWRHGPESNDVSYAPVPDQNCNGFTIRCRFSTASHHHDAAFIADARESLPRACEIIKVMYEALSHWPCFFCNGMGTRGPYERDTPDGSEIVPKHKCASCDGTGIDRQPNGIRAVALARIAAIAEGKDK